MSKGRYGGFRAGRSRIFSNYDVLKSESSLKPDSVTTPVDLDYTTSKGVWNLSSTNQFPKLTSRNVVVGLGPELLRVKDTNNAWSQKTVDISKYANKTVRIVFRYINTRGGNLADLQLDLINVSSTLYSFENVTHSFQTSTTNTRTYSSVSWATIAVATTTGRWNVRTGAVPTAGTGRSDAADGTYYVYAETDSAGSNKDYNFWLRSPSITLGSSPTLSFFEARNGSDIGELYVYIDVIS